MQPIREGGFKRSYSAVDPIDPSPPLPEEILFRIFSQLYHLKMLPCVCKQWDRAHKLYLYNELKSIISIKLLSVFDMYGSDLTCLNLHHHITLKDETLIDIFSKCTNLCHVNINSKYITNKAFQPISIYLLSLSLNCMEVTHTIFKTLSKCTSLQRLVLTTHKMKSLIHLPNLSNLTALKMTLSVSHCDEAGFHHMTGLTALRELDLSFDRLDRRKNKEPPLSPNQNYLTHLTPLPLEKCIFYCRDYKLTEERFTNHLVPFTHLKTLQLHGSNDTYDRGFDLSILSKLTQLDTLSLKRFKFHESHEEANHVDNLKKLYFLKGLELSYICIRGDGNQFNQALQSLPNLLYLKLKAFHYMYKRIHDASDFNEISEDWDIEIYEPSQNWLDPF